MKLQKIDGGISIDGHTWGIDLTQQFSQFLKPKEYNWLEFDFLKFSFQIDKELGQTEIEASIFGLNFYFVFIHDRKQMKKKVKEFNKALKELKR